MLQISYKIINFIILYKHIFLPFSLPIINTTITHYKWTQIVSCHNSATSAANSVMSATEEMLNNTLALNSSKIHYSQANSLNYPCISSGRKRLSSIHSSLALFAMSPQPKKPSVYSLLTGHQIFIMLRELPIIKTSQNIHQSSHKRWNNRQVLHYKKVKKKKIRSHRKWKQRRVLKKRNKKQWKTRPKTSLKTMAKLS